MGGVPQLLDQYCFSLVGVERAGRPFHVVLKDKCESFGIPYDATLPASGNFLNLLNGLPKVAARAEVVCEEQHSLGRPDAVVKTEKAIYIVEFKYAQSADAALTQCREKRYADAYAADGRRVVYVGVNYDPKVRTFDAVKTELAR